MPLFFKSLLIAMLAAIFAGGDGKMVFEGLVEGGEGAKTGVKRQC
jgi:hypothetical protein